MKVSCEKNLLVSAISVASRTVAQKSAITALEGIYVRAGVKLVPAGAAPLHAGSAHRTDDEVCRAVGRAQGG